MKKNTYFLFPILGFTALLLQAYGLSKSQADKFRPQKETVFVAGGTFRMGCTSEQGSDCYNDESPVHRVTVSSFNMSKYEITHTQYAKFLNDQGVGSNGSYNGREYIDMDAEDCRMGYRSGGFYVKGNYGEHPVTDVTWSGADAYARWAGGRLPTEAEWEYAARGGSRGGNYKYSGSDNLDTVGWYAKNSGGGTHPVGQKRANELGLYDMTGNVFEWCSDWYGSYSGSDQTNPTGPASGTYRLARGGSWYNGTRLSRIADRNDFSPDLSNSLTGFRVVFRVP